MADFPELWSAEEKISSIIAFSQNALTLGQRSAATLRFEFAADRIGRTG
jgi:hypothetical protein